MWEKNALLALLLVDICVWALPWIVFAFYSHSNIPDGNFESVADTQILNGFVFAAFHLISIWAISEARDHYAHKEPIRLNLIVKQASVLALEVFLVLLTFVRIPAFIGPGFEATNVTTLTMLKYISIASTIITGCGLAVVLILYLRQQTKKMEAKATYGKFED